MPKRTIALYLTDIVFHTRTVRPATKFNNTVKWQTSEGLPYGRLYTNPGPDGQPRIQIPADLQAILGGFA